MRRLMVYDRLDNPLGDIAEADVFSLVRRATVNGEHALEVTTTRKLGKGQRILMQDGRQIWHEYVVDGIDELHGAGRRPVGTYACVWSIQHDLQGVRVSVMPGVQSPVTAGEALARLLGTTRRWTVGTVTNTSTGGASMYDIDAWSALSTLVKTWGGEVDTTIEVDQAGVVARKVDLYAQQGDQEARRRFDFGADIKSVRRTMPDGPLYCRMTPRGKGEETEGGGYGRKVTIESVNGGKDYLELASMVPLAKLPDGTGGWEYPTLEVENGDCETPEELLAWARGVLEDTLIPKVGYDVDVLQAAREGIDLQGVSLGDAVQVVDRSFGDDGLRVSARVVEMTVDELEDRDVNVKLGHISDGFTSLAAEISQVRDTVVGINGGTLSTADYLDRLISRLNNEINASGGYTYIVPGQGIRTYDTAVSDPLVGAEATKVVEIKGGSIRIANTKTAQGEWEWKSVFTSGHIAAELVTAAQITAGYIGDSTNTSYWDIDNGDIVIVNPSRNQWNRNEKLKFSILSFTDTSGWLNTITTAQQLHGLLLGDDGEGAVSGQSASGNLYLMPNMPVGTGTSAKSITGIAAKHIMKLMGNYSSGSGAYRRGCLALGSEYIEANMVHGHGTVYPGVLVGSNAVYLCATRGDYTTNYGQSATSIDSALNLYADKTTASSMYRSLDIEGSLHIYKRSSVPSATNSKVTLGEDSSSRYVDLKVYGNTNVQGSFSVAGTKNRVASTKNYSKRLLYCYEAPSPMFGDIGSGIIGDDGLCYIEIDDIFSETARTDLSYRVFLQKCGEGDIWVSEKSMTHFVVAGTPGLAFDWEIKAKQAGYEHSRLDNFEISEFEHEESQVETPEVYYVDELQEYIQAIEQAQAG